MRYAFDPALLSVIQEAFVSANIQEECVECSDPSHRDYFFLEFQNQPAMPFEEDDKNAAIDVILSGDKELSEICTQLFDSAATVKLGFRWTGSVKDTEKIVFLGFCIKIIYVDYKATARSGVINRLCDFLRETGLINHDLSQQFRSLVTVRPLKNYYFFKLTKPQDIKPGVLSAVKAYISNHISPVAPAYVRLNELSINPAYQDASIVSERLHMNQKKIWLLRSDFILALGIKNAYWISFSENELSEAISPRLHRFVNWEDRYGHPSLACAHPGYDCDAFYGGLLAQREGYLEIFTSSGRYYRDDLDGMDKKIIEAYLAHLLQKTYGEQTIIFRDSPHHADYFECALFYHDELLPAYCLKREYNSVRISEILAPFSMLQQQVPGECLNNL